MKCKIIEKYFFILFLICFSCSKSYSNTVPVVQQWTVFETAFESAYKYNNPFTDIEVNVVFSSGEQRWTIPAFWSGKNTWSVRFAPPKTGEYQFTVKCSDSRNTKLNSKKGSLKVVPYTGKNLLYIHGFPKTVEGNMHFEYADGTPFLWLGDTWWKNLCKRMTWEGFKKLAADRKTKGFSVIQIVCGPYPDEDPFQPSWANEGGMPYTKEDFSVVNPAYFEYADRRIQHLVNEGLTPAIVGAWGRADCDAMKNVGIEGLKRHWRYLVARYGAYPVMWIVGGEVPDVSKNGEGPWSELGWYVKNADAYHHPLSFHSYPGVARAGDADKKIISFDMIGAHHDEAIATTPETLHRLTHALRVEPPMPALVGETCYEGHMQQGFQYVQRHIFWMYMLSGASGHTYGAAGVWHASVEGDPGCAANGAEKRVYDWTTWEEGMNYPGSFQIGIGKKLLEKYEWWRFKPHAEWSDSICFASGIPGEVRFIYLPRRNIYDWSGPTIKNLDADVDWRGYYFDPATGRKFDIGIISSLKDTPGKKKVHPDFQKKLPSPQDWILVLEKIKK
ncbi:MAG: DUF4038 domain-containing protein [Chitinophagaceae bacterium]|nr:DUF4038 domain-containing protein [Chitinophagaceae bacterium]